MSNIPATVPPDAAPAPSASPVEPQPKAPLPNGGLPDYVTPNKNYDATDFFDKHQAANSAPGAATAPPAAQPVTPAAPAAPAEVPAEPAKGSIAAKLSARNKPAPATAAPAAPADPHAVKNPEDEIHIEFKGDQTKPDSPASHWAKLKGITTGLRDQLLSVSRERDDLRAQLSAAKSGTVAPDAGEVERIRAEHKTMSDRLALVDLREHPEFQAKVLQPQEAALSEAQAIFEANAKTVDLASMLKQTKPEFLKSLGAATKDLSVAEQVEISTHMRNAYALKQQADSMLGKARETYGALRNHSTDQQKKVFESTWQRVSVPITEHLVDLEVPDNATPEQRQQIEEHNSAVAGLRGAAERIAFGSSTAEDISSNAIKAAAYDVHVGKVLPKILGEYESLLKLNAQLADQIKAIKGRNPNIHGTPVGAGGGGPADPQDPRNMDHRAAADHYFKKG